jgi:NAD(P)-dependent dehydrogenase (short-subunit alcohol dehydrogenase family)
VAPGRPVLVTGASSGIGAATSRYLAARGFRVWGTSRQPRADGDGDGIRWLVLDVRDESSVQRAVARLLAAEDGALFGAVCNAGFGIFGSVEETPMDRVRAQFETNVFGVLHTLRAVIPPLRAARAGRIAIVGSLSGRAPIPFQAHYSATKGALDALALALHNELRGFGVHVALIEPGDINTPFNDVTDWGVGAASSAYGAAIASTERLIKELLPKAPGPEVVARAVEHALGARRPRVRYAVGADSKLVPVGKRLLPDRGMLALIRDHFGF